MATRTSFRPRPVDVNKQLVIVRDLSELDTTDGLLPKEPEPAQHQQQHQHQQGDGHAADGAGAGSSHTAAAHAKKNKPKEIPVPEVKDVPTYTRDYLPTFKIPNTYIRGRGGTNYTQEDFVEYDLDDDDEDWLEAFNRRGDNRLADTKFERMLWRLELAWSEAAEASLAASERTSAVALASTACLSKVQALSVLRKSVGGRDIILEQVYEYWAAKRKRLGKPILRRLQAPTNPTDTNPFNVFRPREKVNRPLTRRRRENSAECLEKLRQIRENMLRAMELAEMVLLRERKKGEVHGLDMLVQRCQLSLHHQPPHTHAMVENLASVRLMEARRRCAALDQRLAMFLDAPQQGTALLDESMRRALRVKRRRMDTAALAYMAITTADTLAKVPPPVPAPEAEPLWAYQPALLDLLPPSSSSTAAASKLQDASKASKASDAKSAAAAASQPASPAPISLTPELQAALQSGAAQPYIGRGGRLVLARCDPLTLEPFGPLGSPSALGASSPSSLANHQQQQHSAAAGSSNSTAAGEAEGGEGQQQGGDASQWSVGAIASALLATGGALPPAVQSVVLASGSGAGGGAAEVAAATAAVLNEPVPDAVLYSFQPPALSPWALSFDVRLLPDFVDKHAVLVQQQKYLRQQQLLGRVPGGNAGGARVNGVGVPGLGRMSSGGGAGGGGRARGMSGSGGVGGLVSGRLASPPGGGGGGMARQGSGALQGGGAGVNGAAHKLLPQARAVTGPSFQLNRGPAAGRGAQQGGSDVGFPLLDGADGPGQ